MVIVNQTQLFQEFYGVGGSLTESSAWLISPIRTQNTCAPGNCPPQPAEGIDWRLPSFPCVPHCFVSVCRSVPVLSPAQRKALLGALFDPVDGAGFRMVRLPMGTSDFRWADRTYDDEPAGAADWALANFSVAADDAFIFPTLRDAIGVNPDIKARAGGTTRDNQPYNRRHRHLN